MQRRVFLGGVCASLVASAAGCSALGKVSSSLGQNSVLSTAGSFSTRGGARTSSARSAATLGRSLRLSSGYFFGHDVRPFRSVVYVLDLSGSMSERSGSALSRAARDTSGSVLASVGGDLGSAAGSAVSSMDKKVELVKDHLNASLRGLGPDATFNIVLFSGDVQTLSPTMLSASTATTLAVSTFVSKLVEGGATNMMRAIEVGLETDAEDIMVLTDGIPTDATPEQILEMADQKNADRDRHIYTVGVGADQAEPFLTQLASQHGGAYLAYK